MPFMTVVPIPCKECGKTMELGVYRSAAGFYLGYWCDCGPYSRIGGYFRTRKEAESQLAVLKEVKRLLTS